jgi:acetyltransferase EpsM
MILILKEIVVIGASAFSEIQKIIQDINTISMKYKVIGILDDNLELQSKEVDGVPVIGTLADANSLSQEVNFVFAIGSYKSRMLRYKLLTQLGFQKERYETLIHPSANIYSSSTIGFGCVIHPNVVVFNNTIIEDFVFILPNTIIGSHNKVYEGALITSLVSTTSNVKVGPYSHIGTGSIVAEGKKIGAGAQVGMGSNVFKNIPNGFFSFGNPPRYLGKEDVPIEIIQKWEK